MKKIIIISLTLFMVLTVNINLTKACSCVFPEPPLEALQNSDAVFSGEVISISYPTGPVISNADKNIVIFRVIETWKGLAYSSQIVKTKQNVGSCGYAFVEGEEYIVYAYNINDELNVDRCSRTKLLSEAQEDLDTLGEGTSPDIYTDKENKKYFMELLRSFFHYSLKLFGLLHNLIY